MALRLRVLLVEPDPELRGTLEAVAVPFARVDACSSFASARTHLKTAEYDLLVTALRLREYNGLHLVYLANAASSASAADAASAGKRFHALVYDEKPDLNVAREVQRAGAFYEIAERIAVTLPSFLPANLPDADRRAPAMFDRRQSVRGGRRLWDRNMLASGATSWLDRRHHPK